MQGVKARRGYSLGGQRIIIYSIENRTNDNDKISPHVRRAPYFCIQPSIRKANTQASASTVRRP